MRGWHGKLLRVNLTAGTCKTEKLNEQWATEYLGGRGLGSKYFTEEVEPDVDPLAPENKLIMAAGPLTGTYGAANGRYMVITKSPLTGTIACSNSGGYFPCEMRYAGYDMIIFEGKAEYPSYLQIHDDKVQLVARFICGANRATKRKMPFWLNSTVMQRLPASVKPVKKWSTMPPS